MPKTWIYSGNGTNGFLLVTDFVTMIYVHVCMYVNIDLVVGLFASKCLLIHKPLLSFFLSLSVSSLSLRSIRVSS